jgi:protein-tyrosine phosphatase
VIRILFVCYGNICRSPMAEAVFQHLVDQAGLADQVVIDSAGTSAVNIGGPAHPGTRDVLLRHGIVYEGRARQVSLADIDEADYVVAMDYDNQATLARVGVPSDLDEKLYLLLAFAPDVSDREVPDPIYDGRFERVYDLIEAGCRGLLDHIRTKHNL